MGEQFMAGSPILLAVNGAGPGRTRREVPLVDRKPLASNKFSKICFLIRPCDRAGSCKHFTKRLNPLYPVILLT